jgi:aminopeptidase N
VEVVVDRASVRVPGLEGIKAPAFVYANAEDHGYAKFFLDERSLDFAKAHLDKIDSAFLRTVVWRNLWFMVRDRAIRPDVLIELALAKLGSEPDFRLVASAWENTFDAWQDYLPAERREEVYPRLKELAARGLAAAGPGSDLQKAWFKAAVAVPDRVADAGWLLDVLEGREILAGLEIDQEKRWSLVGRLCWMGHPRAVALLEAEAGRDKSERGIKAALRARAALPDAGQKAAMWERFTAKGDDHLDLLREAMGGFMAYGQLPLVERYVKAWLADLPKVVEERETSFARSFARGLFPGSYAEPWIRDEVEKLIAAHPGFPVTVSRSLVESLDEMKRTLAILDQYRR